MGSETQEGRNLRSQSRWQVLGRGLCQHGLSFFICNMGLGWE